MVTFQVAGDAALQFNVAARSVLLAGSRCGQVEPSTCQALIEQFRRHGFGFFVAARPGWMPPSARRWLTQNAAPTRCSSAARSASAHGAAGPRDCSPRRWCPRAPPPKAALARRTLWLVKRSSLVVLFPERPADRQWGPGSRHVFRSSLYHLKPLFVVASRPPVAPAFCQVVASDLFATVDGYWVVPHTFRDGFCDDEY